MNKKKFIIGSNIIVLNYGLSKIIIVMTLVIYELYFIFPILKNKFVMLKIYIIFTKGFFIIF